MVKVCPAIVSVPALLATPALAAAWKLTVPVPFPLPPEVTERKPALAAALQPHPDGAVTVIAPEPPKLVNDAPAEDSE